jgi:hypothetical protein
VHVSSIGEGSIIGRLLAEAGLTHYYQVFLSFNRDGPSTTWQYKLVLSVKLAFLNIVVAKLKKLVKGDDPFIGLRMKLHLYQFYPSY